MSSSIWVSKVGVVQPKRMLPRAKPTSSAGGLGREKTRAQRWSSCWVVDLLAKQGRAGGYFASDQSVSGVHEGQHDTGNDGGCKQVDYHFFQSDQAHESEKN